MPDWIVQHWAKWLFGIIGAGVTSLAGYVTGKLRSNRRLDAIEKALRASLYDRLYYLHGKYCKQSWVSVPDLENFVGIYEGYHGLGGNGTGTKLFDDVMHLRNFPADGKEKT